MLGLNTQLPGNSQHHPDGVHAGAPVKFVIAAAAGQVVTAGALTKEPIVSCSANQSVSTSAAKHETSALRSDDQIIAVPRFDPCIAAEGSRIDFVAAVTCDEVRGFESDQHIVAEAGKGVVGQCEINVTRFDKPVSPRAAIQQVVSLPPRQHIAG